MADDHHDRDDDPDLVFLRATLRAEGQRRTGDLPSLFERSHDRQRRVRVAAAVLSALLVLAVGGAVVRGTTQGAADLRVGDAPSGTTTTPSIATGSAAPTPTVPPWTVNPSIPIDSEKVWALRVVLDPAVWDERRYTEIFDLASPYGANAMADERGAPVLDLYWKEGSLPPGQDPRRKAEDAAAAVQRLPGVVSVEVGTAVPTKRTPATRSPFPNGSTPAPPR